MKKSSIFLLFFPFLLTACLAASSEKGVFVKEGTTFSTRQRDFTACEVSALNQVPRAMATATTPTYTTPVYQTPSYTNCYGYGNSVQCTTTGGQQQGGQTYGGQSYNYDANANLRERVFVQCMASKGYSAVRVPRCTARDLETGKFIGLTDALPSPGEIGCYSDSPKGLVVLAPV